MKEVKRLLIERNGTRCMLCRQDVKMAIQWHHAQPKYAKGDNSYNNGTLLCDRCHKHIHQFQFGTTQYTQLTIQILKNKNGG